MFYFLFILTSGIVTAKPAPAPPPESMPLWHSSATLASLGMPLTPPPEPGISLHHFELSCQTCHIPGNTNNNSNYEQDNIWQMSVDINSACLSSGCHNYSHTLNHPIGVTVTTQVHDDLPLDNSSQITCLTCHSDPDYSPSANPEDNMDSRMLISPRGDDLCASCHLKMSGTTVQKSHWRFSNKAHLGSINPDKIQSSNRVYTFRQIDSESQTCVSCHEDVTITIPGENETMTERYDRRSRMRDHPIGMSYQRTMTNDMYGFNVSAIDNEEIRFFDGKVGCGSCHSLYSRQKNYVVANTNGKTLCRQCHNR